ncbi:hypothetical protein D4764_04G0009910 [Takifugu flavidus]|uniref:Uncharacterized protein n=1 Tax=Takifugu flavidus TaxID=433684 RepID=A0A5C6N4F4_9TELE|nr:hypothetical protein D4764_04G0009910 [Takifugu flavidus]
MTGSVGQCFVHIGLSRGTNFTLKLLDGTWFTRSNCTKEPLRTMAGKANRFRFPVLGVKEEMTALRLMTMQNRMALDLITAPQGGVCAMVEEGFLLDNDEEESEEEWTNVMQDVNEMFEMS